MTARRAMPPLAALFFAGCCLLAPVGCSPSAITTHARVAQVVGPVLDTAREVILAARSADLDGCAVGETPEVRLSCLDEREARWRPGVLAYNLAREAFAAWIEAMELANLAGTPDAEAGEILLPLALALVRLYDGVETALEPFEELDLPDFPGLGLLTGPTGGE